MVKTSVDLSGPFFTGDPGKTLAANIRTMLEAVAKEGERAVRAELIAGASGRAEISELGDRVAEHAVGRVKSITGREWWEHATISVNNSGFSAAQGVSLMAAASEVEGRTQAFRHTASGLRASRAVIIAELTKGLE